MEKRALFLIKSAPYGTLRVTEGYRAALGMAATGISTRVVLLGDGVYAALEGQSSSGIDQTNVGELMESLTDLGIDVLIHAPSAAERQLDGEKLIPLATVPGDNLKELLDESHAVFVF